MKGIAQLVVDKCEILALDTGNAVQLGSSWGTLTTPETLSVPNGFNLGNFSNMGTQTTNQPYTQTKLGVYVCSPILGNASLVYVRMVDNMSSATYFATRVTGTYICSTGEILRIARLVATDLCSDLYCSMRSSTLSLVLSGNANLS